MTEAKLMLKLLADKLRSRSNWMHDPTYGDSESSRAQQAVLDGIAEDIEEVLAMTEKEMNGTLSPEQAQELLKESE